MGIEWRSESRAHGGDVAGLIERADLSHPAVAGLSMGGYAALALAAKYPDLARAYGLVSTQAAPDDEEGRQRRADGLATLRNQGWRAFAERLLPKLLAEAHPDLLQLRKRLLAMFERAGDSGLTATLFTLAGRPDRRPLLPKLRAPSVVLVGDADQLTPAAKAKEMSESAPNSRLVVLPGVAHMSAMEAPAEVARALVALL